MWNKKYSINLSKFFTIVFILALLVCFALGPWLVKLVMWYSYNAQPQYYWFFIATLYSSGVLAGVLLITLYRLLWNIGKGVVFEDSNVSLLRKLSWCCFGITGITMVSGFYYMPWWFIMVCAGFIGLIVRVVKNIMAEAVYLKQENDFTI